VTYEVAVRRELMSRRKEPREWGDIFENEDPAFYKSEDFQWYVEEVERPPVRNFIVKLLGRFTGVVPHPEADDATNVAFFKVYTLIDSRMLAGLSSATARLLTFRAFEYKVAQNAVFDLLREHKRRGLDQRVPDDYERQVQRQAVEQHYLSERSLKAADDLRNGVAGKWLDALKVALSFLDERDRTLLLGRAEGKSYSDLALEFGCSEACLRVRHYRAMKALIALLRRELPEDMTLQNHRGRRNDDA
jgi:RNA polymerase sigma factor (sigma-70 family)